MILRVSPRLIRRSFHWAWGSLLLLNLIACTTSTRYGFGGSTSVTVHLQTQSVLDCARAEIARVDDGRSDASTVALTLAQSCYSEYQAAINAFADVNLRNDAQRSRFLDDRNSVSGRIEFFLPIVMEYRQRVPISSDRTIP